MTPGKELLRPHLGHGRLTGHTVPDQPGQQLHGLTGGLLPPAADPIARLVGPDEKAAIGVDQVVPAIDGISLADGQSKAAVVPVGQLAGVGVQRLPGPGLVRVGQAPAVKDRLVIPQGGHRAVLGQGIGLAAALERPQQLAEVILQLNSAVTVQVLVQGAQIPGGNAVLGVAAVHPEDIRGCAVLQLCPIGLPAFDHELYLDIVLLRPGLGQRLPGLLLGFVPDPDGELFGVELLPTAAASQAQQHCQSQQSGQPVFPFHIPFLLPDRHGGLPPILLSPFYNKGPGL